MRCPQVPFWSDTVLAAGLDWRPRVHGSAARQRLVGAGCRSHVQQVRRHLGRISLRAVERYLHNPPGAEAGAAGAISRVKATGGPYPAITPSYTPAPAIPGPPDSLQWDRATDRDAARAETGHHGAARVVQQEIS